MKIPFQDFRRQHESIDSELDEAIARVRKSEWYILGPEVEAFEQEFADYCGVKYAIGVGNGTEALQIAIMACKEDSDKRNEIITIANTAVPTGAAIRMADCYPVFSEISSDSWTIDPERISETITEKTMMIIPVHLYGNPAEMEEIKKIAIEKDLIILEDCCQAHGANINGKKVGSFGDISAFSFYPSKNLGALGDGGIILTDNEDYAKKCRLLRNYGQTARNEHSEWGINSRLDDMQAAFLRVKLRHLDDWNDMRVKAANSYIENLSNTPLKFQEINGGSVYHLLVARLPDGIKREDFILHMHEKGIACAIHYPKAIYEQPSYKKYAPEDSLPLTEKHCASIVSLPIFPLITDEEIEYVSDKILIFFSK